MSRVYNVIVDVFTVGGIVPQELRFDVGASNLDDAKKAVREELARRKLPSPRSIAAAPGLVNTIRAAVVVQPMQEELRAPLTYQVPPGRSKKYK